VRYMTFGKRTGLRVSQYALGTANFGTRWAKGADPAECRRMFEAFAEAGGTFLDTADIYQYGESESLLGQFLAGDRDHFVVASKFTHGSGPDAGLMETGNSRKTLVLALEASLRRLGTDYLDLYWAHWPDFVTPVEEIVATFDDLVRQGKILYGGLSNFPAWRIARGATIAGLRGSSLLVGAQFEYSLATRDAERELLPMAEGLGLGVAFYSPLRGGLLTGKHRHNGQGHLTATKSGVQAEDAGPRAAVVDAVVEVASDIGVTPSRVALAWVNKRAGKSATAVLPIIGPRTMAQLDDYVAALDVTLTAEQYERLDRVSAPILGIPHEGANNILNSIFGGGLGQFDRLSAAS
jgi:aryl-alcohol dehydrogenase-like predicted oxidoreductase